MTRPIKFRAWYEGKMHDINEMHLGGGIWSVGMIGIPRLHDLELMQYTGLKDKHGVEIYEGDITRLRFHEAPGGESFENGEIKWHEDSAAFKWFSGDASDLNNYWLTQADDKYREVIGNIYENPELLKEPADAP